jgi:hypothetical protein
LPDIKLPEDTGKVKMLNVIIICFGFSAIVLISYFLMAGQIGSAAYTTLFLCILLASLGLYGFDRLRVFDLKNLMFRLDEIKEVQKDVYAKAETVKALGEEIAELTAFNVTRVGRFAGPDLQKKMIEARDKIKKVLQSLGSSEAKMTALSKEIEDMVLHDLKRNVESETDRITHEALTRGRQFDRDQIQKRIRELLTTYDRKGIVRPVPLMYKRISTSSLSFSV